MGIIGQSDQQIAGAWFRFTVFEYSATSETFLVDPSAMGSAIARVFHLEGGTPPNAAVTATSADTTVRGSTSATVTIGASTAGTFGRILVITQHGSAMGGIH